MTVLLRTLDGEIEAGYYSGDISRVRLGELPPMTTVQFVGFVAVALSEGVVPRLDEATKADWASDLHELSERLQSMPVKVASGRFFAQSPAKLTSQLDGASQEARDEISAELAAQVVPVSMAEHYTETPFVVEREGTRIAFQQDGVVHHVVASEDFFNLACQILNGGWRGWRNNIPYPEVQDATSKLETAFSH